MKFFHKKLLLFLILSGSLTSVCIFFCFIYTPPIGLDPLDQHSSRIRFKQFSCVNDTILAEKKSTSKPVLRFSGFKTFRIVQFADLHWGTSGEGRGGEGGGVSYVEDGLTRLLQFEIIEQERPDLVVLSGDQIDIGARSNTQRAIHNLLYPLEHYQIPYCSIYGNHDADALLKKSNATFDLILSSELQCQYSLTQAGSLTKSYRFGNYILPVFLSSNDSTPFLNLVFLDSGRSLHGTIENSQIAWLHSALTSSSSSSYSPFSSAYPSTSGQSVLFIHTPLKQHDEVWSSKTCWGQKLENFEGQMFRFLSTAQLKEMGIVAVISGHDHKNDYCGEEEGILFCYGRVTGYRGYGGRKRGARVIELKVVLEDKDEEKDEEKDDNNKSRRRTRGGVKVNTWIREEGGEIVVKSKKLHSPGLWGRITTLFYVLYGNFV